MTSTRKFPCKIEPFKWAEQGFSWSGKVPLTDFPRITQDILDDIENQWVNIECKLSLHDHIQHKQQLIDRHIIWLDAHLTTTLTLPCQRCLEGIKVPIDANVHVAILDDEKDIARIDDDVDFIILGEDLGTQKGDYKTPATIDLIYLLEDELLLSFPNIPKHEECNIQHQNKKFTTEPIEEKKENPFEILANLKGKLGS